MLAENLTVAAYQDLLERGWRRSGNYLYRPHLEGYCCPHYTIRLESARFQPSAAQRRALRKVELFASGAWAARAAARNNGSALSAAAEPGLSSPDTAPLHGRRDSQARNSSSRADPGVGDRTVRTTAADALAAERCSALLRNRAQAAAPGDQLAALSAAHITFSVQRRVEAAVATDASDAGSHGGGAAPARTQTQCSAGTEAPEGSAVRARVSLRCSVCWEAAARQAAPPASSASKSAAKKARKRQQASSPDVATVAAHLASTAVLPALRDSLAQSAELAQLRSEAWAERGHLWVTLDAASCSPLSAYELDVANGAREAAREAEGNGGLATALASDGTCGSEGSMDTSTDTDAERCAPDDAHINATSPTPATAAHAPYTHASARVPSANGADRPRQGSDEGRERWWQQLPPGGRWPLRIVLQRSTFQEDEWHLWRRYQQAVHRDPAHRLTASAFGRFLVESPFPAEDSAAAPVSYVMPTELFGAANAATTQAQDECITSDVPPRSVVAAGAALRQPRAGAGSMAQSSAAQARAGDSTGGRSQHSGRAEALTARDGKPSCGYGAFHMQFWFGDHLAAICVIDILPRCDPAGCASGASHKVSPYAATSCVLVLGCRLWRTLVCTAARDRRRWPHTRCCSTLSVKSCACH